MTQSVETPPAAGEAPRHSNRSAEYRKRAEETRQAAAATIDVSMRKTLLQTAETWERMAAYEDEHNPPALKPTV